MSGVSSKHKNLPDVSSRVAASSYRDILASSRLGHRNTTTSLGSETIHAVFDRGKGFRKSKKASSCVTIFGLNSTVIQESISMTVSMRRDGGSLPRVDSKGNEFLVLKMDTACQIVDRGLGSPIRADVVRYIIHSSNSSYS